jgi:V8-like Glu-specific endopeptidase
MKVFFSISTFAALAAAMSVAAKDLSMLRGSDYGVPPSAGEDSVGGLLSALDQKSQEELKFEGILGEPVENEVPDKTNQKTIFGPDDRVPFDDTSFPYRTVGRVETAAGSCTGTMVGRRLMVTAQHCVNRLGSGGIGWMKFTPAYNNGYAPYGSANARHIYYSERIDASDLLSPWETAFDWAVVVLDRNLGAEIGFMGYMTYNSAWNGGNYWENIGYPGDHGSHVPVWTPKGPIDSVSSFVASDGDIGYRLEHHIDIVGGHSGGPLYGYWNDLPYIVGVQSGENSATNSAGGGPELANMISRLREEYD